MTEIAQTHSELEALLARVKQQVHDCELNEAILVDDKLVVELTDTQWIQAVSKVKAEDAPTHEKLKRAYRESGLDNVEEFPPDDLHEAAVAIIKGSSSAAAVEIINEERFKEPALDKLYDILDKVGLKPTYHTGIAGVARTGKLYFLDYRMQGNDHTAGHDATVLLKELVERKDEIPPSAILMSRGVDERPNQSDWEEVAKNAGYYRFNFRYLDKVKLETGEMGFLFFLHELLESYPVGKDYYTQLQKLKSAADQAANTALADIRQLNPSEFGIYAGMFLGDDTGRKASRHLLELFLGLLDAAVKENESLEASFREFAKMLALKPMLAMKDKDTHALHQLHTRLLYDCSKWVLTGPIVFGDMYRKEKEADVYYLVITPECDLELRFKREVWMPKANEILMLRGQVVEQPTEKHPENYVGMPFISDAKTKWIRWQLREARFVPAESLITKAPGAPADKDGYVKWGRLRHMEAEQVQQEYASDLVAVGTDDISGMTQPLTFEFWHVQGHVHQQLDDLVIVQTVNLKDEKNPFWAFGEGCELLLCPESETDQFFPFAELIELRKPVPKKTFLEKCKKRKLHYVEAEGESPLFVRWSQNPPKNWKPNRPAKEKEEGDQASTDAPPPDDTPGDQQPSAGKPPPTPPGTEAETISLIDLREVTDIEPKLPGDKKE